MGIPKACDVCIIGGGPAGATAAALLSKKGYHVVVLECARHPRYSVGESVIPHFWRYVSDSGAADAIENEGFIQKAGGTVQWHNEIRQMTFSDFGHQRPALHVERDRFDFLLIENARVQGALVFEDTKATAVVFCQNNRSKVEYRANQDAEYGQIECRFVIDASGQRSLLARQMNTWELDDDFRFCSIWGYFKDAKYVGSDGVAHDFQDISRVGPTTFVSSLGEWGWSWHIPLRKTSSIGFVVPTTDFKKLKRREVSSEKVFLQLCETTPTLSELLRSASFEKGSTRVVRDYSYRAKRFAGPGWFLIGDAAAFVDPIFSVGVVLGMYSATLAAWTVDHTLQDAGSADHYRAIFESQFGVRLDIARALALPGYEPDADKRATAVVQYFKFQSQAEQELASVVSAFTHRSKNYVDMMGGCHSAKTSQKFRRLDAISF